MAFFIFIHVYRIFLCFSPRTSLFFFFFFNDTATTEIYTLSLHDALPIFARQPVRLVLVFDDVRLRQRRAAGHLRRQRLDHGQEEGRPLTALHPERGRAHRSEEHTSELQSRSDLVCRLLLEKKKKKRRNIYDDHGILENKHSKLHAPPRHTHPNRSFDTDTCLPPTSTHKKSSRRPVRSTLRT